MSGKYYIFDYKGEKIISKLRFQQKYRLSDRKMNDLIRPKTGYFLLDGELCTYNVLKKLAGERKYNTRPGPKENTSKLIEVKQPYKIIGNLKLIYSPNTGDLIKTIAI